jgi:hypothetical protein
MTIRSIVKSAIILALIPLVGHAKVGGGDCQSIIYPGGVVGLGLVNIPTGVTSQVACYPAVNPSAGAIPAGCATLNLTGLINTNFTRIVLVPNPKPPTPPGCTNPGTMSVTFSGTGGISGWITPKYQVVGLTYTPPGSKSTATYSNGFNSGSSMMNTSSFKQGVTVSYTVNGGFDLFGLLSSKVTNTASAGWTQTTGSSNSLSLSQTYSSGLVVPGPASSGVGVDHDFDTVYVWLNPAVQLFLSGVSVTNQGYNWDERDTVTGMDVIPLTIGQLRGVQAIAADTQARLNRTWDGNLGALTSTDLLAIALADPFFGNPSFNPNTDTSGRFEFPNGVRLLMNYVPEPAGGQATGQTYTSSYTSTSAAGQSASTMYTVGYAVAGGVDANFLVSLSGNVRVSGSYSYTDGWSSTATSGTTQAANFTIFPPLMSDNYTGPTAIQVWKDNVYGSFMFYPEN